MKHKIVLVCIGLSYLIVFLLILGNNFAGSKIHLTSDKGIAAPSKETTSPTSFTYETQNPTQMQATIAVQNAEVISTIEEYTSIIAEETVEETVPNITTESATEPSTSPIETVVPFYVTFHGSQLYYIRSKPDPNSRLIGQIPPDKIATVIGIYDDKWYEIKYEGLHGYCFREWLIKVTEDDVQSQSTEEVLPYGG